MTPPLGLLTVAALFPKDWELRGVDENIKMLDQSDIGWADFVLVGAKIVHRARALKVIEWVQQLGKPLAVGGPDPTISPHTYDELGIDYLCLGEGEGTIPNVIEDFRKGVAKGVYRCEGLPDVKKAPIPRFDLVDLNDYLYVGI